MGPKPNFKLEACRALNNVHHVHHRALPGIRSKIGFNEREQLYPGTSDVALKAQCMSRIPFGSRDDYKELFGYKGGGYAR